MCVHSCIPDGFVRYICGTLRTKMVKSLIPTFTAGGESRLDLFRTWLEKGQDFTAVELEVTRKNSQKQLAKSTAKCMSKRELEQDPRYTPEDVKDLIERKTRAGEFICDPNFPLREDLRQYLVNTETIQENQHAREDEQTMRGTTQLGAEEALSLTETGSVFGVNETPGIHALAGVVLGQGQGEGQGDQGKGKGKTKKGKGKGKNKGKGKGQNTTGEDGDENGEGEPDKPPTPLEKAGLLKKAVFLVLPMFGKGLVYIQFSIVKFLCLIRQEKMLM